MAVATRPDLLLQASKKEPFPRLVLPTCSCPCCVSCLLARMFREKSPYSTNTATLSVSVSSNKYMLRCYSHQSPLVHIRAPEEEFDFAVCAIAMHLHFIRLNLSSGKCSHGPAGRSIPPRRRSQGPPTPLDLSHVSAFGSTHKQPCVIAPEVLMSLIFELFPKSVSCSVMHSPSAFDIVESLRIVNLDGIL